MTGLYGRIHNNDQEFCCDRAKGTNNARHNATCKNFVPEYRIRQRENVAQYGRVAEKEIAR